MACRSLRLSYISEGGGGGGEIVSNGWRASGVTEAIVKGTNELESLDPFACLDPLDGVSDCLPDEGTVQATQESIGNFITQKEVLMSEDSDDEWEYEDGTAITIIFEILNGEQGNLSSNFIIVPRILNQDMLPHFVSICIYIEKKKNIKLVNHHTDLQFFFHRIGQGWVLVWAISVFIYATQNGKTRPCDILI